MIGRFYRMASVASAVTILLGTAVLLGWFLDVPLLKSMLPGLVTMKANTAAAFVLTGVSLGLQVEPSRARRVWIARLCGGAALAIGALTLLEHAAGVDISLDHLLVHAQQAELQTSSPGRMAPNTALGFALLGTALVVLDSRTRALQAASQALAITVLLIASVAIVGYAYRVTAFYGVPGYASMAVHTAIGLVILATGMLAARPERGVIAIVAQDNSAGRTVRRLLPLVIISLPALAWLRLKGQHAGLYGTEAGAALMATVSTGVVVAFALWNARSEGLADAERKRAAEQFRVAMEAAPTGMLMVERTGRIILVNAQVERLFGYGRAELLGQPVEVLIPKRFRASHAQLRSAFVGTPVARAMGAGRALFGLHKDGTQLPIEVGLNPLTTSDGDFVLTSVVDIKERQTLESAAERDRFFQLSIDMMCIANSTGRFLQLNPAFEQVLGYPLAELLTQPFVDFIHPDDRPATLREIANLSAGGVTVDFKNRYRCKDGSYRWLQWRSMPDQTGLIYAVARDVTEDTNAVRALQTIAREREVLLQEVHHRVKNNLQVISSMINMQTRKVVDLPTRSALCECQARIEAIALIHEQLYRARDYARVPFSAYARSLADNIFHGSGVFAEGVGLELDIGELALAVDTAIPCGLILNELITNALKHAFPNARPGVVRVELHKAGEHEMVLAVADDGVGLPTGFEIDNAGTLGMQLVSTLVEQLDGRLEISRSAGTRFSVTFSPETSA